MRAYAVWVAGAAAVIVGASVLAGDAVQPAEDQKNEMKQLMTQQGELKTALREVHKRLNVEKDPQVVDLKKAVEAAQKAYTSKVEELVKNDPEGAALVLKIQENEAKILALKQAAQNKPKKEPAVAKEPKQKGKKDKAAEPAM